MNPQLTDAGIPPVVRRSISQAPGSFLPAGVTAPGATRAPRLGYGISRFAGPQIGINPASMPYTGRRFAGAVAKQNPDLVERITGAIMPGIRRARRGSTQEQPAAQG